MKILILTQYFPPEVGAPQNRLYELAIRLKKKGADITVLTAMPNYPQMEVHERYKGLKYFYEEMEGLKIHRSSIHVSKNRSILSRLRNYFSFVWSSYKTGKKKLKNFDFLLCESPPLFLGISAVKLAGKKKAKLIFNVSDLWPESAEKLGIVKNKLLLGVSYKLEKWIYKRSFFITGQTQGIVKNISNRFPDKKTYWLPNGVDTNYFDPSKLTSNWRKENNFEEDDFIIFYAGIIGHAYNFEIVLKSAEMLAHLKKIKFILLGSGPDKDKTVLLKNSMKLTNVFFYDTVPKANLPNIIAAVNALVIPLRKTDLSEGTIPSKIFENLAMKVPVLLGAEGESKKLFIDEGKAGLFFEPENEKSLTENILKLYNDRELLMNLGENGRKYVSGKFNRDKITEDFWKALTSL